MHMTTMKPGGNIWMFPRLPFSLNFCYVIARSHTPRTKNSNQMLLKFVTLVSFSISVKKGRYFKAYLTFMFFKIFLQEASPPPRQNHNLR